MSTKQRTYAQLSGPELAQLRRNAGLTQTELAQATGIGRHAVSSWENKDVVDLDQIAPRRMFAVLGIKVAPCRISLRLHAQARARSHGVLLREERALAQLEVRQEARKARQDARRKPKPTATAAPAQQQATCGARTRKGQPCCMRSEPGRTRCKLHGGKSTGPKTPEGRAKIAEAQRRRWAAWRA